tara:strand:+ start:701 stop:1273 length:573 start_codon:yes stop_codon:yes gene_type:complete
MPFKSEKQRKWMYANEPEIAKKWEKKEQLKKETKVRNLIKKMVREKNMKKLSKTSKKKIREFILKERYSSDLNDLFYQQHDLGMTNPTSIPGMERQIQFLSGMPAVTQMTPEELEFYNTQKNILATQDHMDLVRNNQQIGYTKDNIDFNNNKDFDTDTTNKGIDWKVPTAAAGITGLALGTNKKKKKKNA